MGNQSDEKLYRTRVLQLYTENANTCDLQTNAFVVHARGQAHSVFQPPCIVTVTFYTFSGSHKRSPLSGYCDDGLSCFFGAYVLLP